MGSCNIRLGGPVDINELTRQAQRAHLSPLALARARCLLAVQRVVSLCRRYPECHPAHCARLQLGGTPHDVPPEGWIAGVWLSGDPYLHEAVRHLLECDRLYVQITKDE